jgi:hypothetical protein
LQQLSPCWFPTHWGTWPSTLHLLLLLLPELEHTKLQLLLLFLLHQQATPFLLLLLLLLEVHAVQLLLQLQRRLHHPAQRLPQPGCKTRPRHKPQLQNRSRLGQFRKLPRSKAIHPSPFQHPQDLPQ